MKNSTDIKEHTCNMLIAQIDEHVRRIQKQAKKLGDKNDIAELKKYVMHLVQISEV